MRGSAHRTKAADYTEGGCGMDVRAYLEKPILVGLDHVEKSN
jgi:hypothetical protein